MAWKVMCACLALAMVLSVAAPASAATAEIYDGNISTTLTEYFSDILVKVSPLKNYVLIRSSQYVYVLYVGVFDWNGTSFHSDSCDLYTITTNSGYNSNYTFRTSTLSDVNIIPGDYLVYSDLGPFPALRDSYSYWGMIIASILMVMLFCYLIRSIFWRLL